MRQENGEINSLSPYLNQLVTDKQLKANEKRLCLETIITIYRNVVTSADDKYRRIKTSNKTFIRKVWKHWAAKCLLLNHGWRVAWDDVDERRLPTLRFTEIPENVVNGWIQVLIQCKLNVKPSDDEVRENERELDQQLREEELRRRGEEERNQRLEELIEDSNQRKILADIIKKEIRADNKYRQDLNRQRKDEEDDQI